MIADLREYKIIDEQPDIVMEPLIVYIAANKVQRSIKPVYKTAETALYNDDCLEIMNRFPDNYVDMIFADPPYNLSNGGITCHAGKMVSVDKGKWDKSEGFGKDLEFHNKWISECRRILKPDVIVQI
jgi:site-specific DNA-methyltransferase (adenine-specific)